MKKIFQNKVNVLIAILIVVVLALLVILLLSGHEAALPILIALIVLGVLWIAIEMFLRSRKRRRQKRFDDSLVAKEGIQDRKREWGTWVEELERQDIDRYELPFYLLVGEPQSGKSILLQNSDLHFPFGQTRLSGVGGTRGCDWWFTDEAVILDLAGRLFTHEGGAADELEWAAFLDLLADFRPLCPANGILLVIPCDGLLQDQRDAVLHKASKIQNALVTLSNKLQAQMPVYVVLTKADKIFGFAECVHRLDQPQRQQMFGWSRENPKFDAPFQIEEARDGFATMVQRAQLLRSEMVATSALPEDIGAVHRMVAFPEELRSLWPSLELYLKAIFTDSSATEKLFFRGLYLTSGLQTGVPIAKACAALVSGSREADSRALEALFVKQRAYFIKDLVRERVFGERGLVRPTSSRVQRARRSAWIGYGVAATIALAAVGWSVFYASTAKADDLDVTGKQAVKVGNDAVKLAGRTVPVSDTLARIEDMRRAIEDPSQASPTHQRENALEEMRAAIVQAQLLPALRREAIRGLRDGFRDPRRSPDHATFLRRVRLASALRGPLEYGSSANAEIIDELANTLAAAGVRKADLQPVLKLCADATEVLPAGANRDVEDLIDAARAAFDRTIEPGCPWQVRSDLGLFLAWKGLSEAHGKLVKLKSEDAANVHALAATYNGSTKLLGTSGDTTAPDRLSAYDALDQLNALRRLRVDLGLARDGERSDAWGVSVENFVHDPDGKGVDSTPIRERAEVDKDLARYRDTDLEAVCDAEFLPLEGWSVEGLSAGFLKSMLEPRKPRYKRTSPAGAVLAAKCAALAKRFDASVRDWRSLREGSAFVDLPAQDSATGFDHALAAPLVELLANARMLEAETKEIGPFASRVEDLLESHMSGEAPGVADLRRESQLGVVGALYAASKHPGLRTAAGGWLRAVLRELQGSTEKRWSDPNTSIEESATALFELEDLLNEATGEAEPLGVDVHVEWLDSVDRTLCDRVTPALDAFRSTTFKFDSLDGLPMHELGPALQRMLSEAGFRSWVESVREARSTQPNVDLERLAKLTKQLFAALNAWRAYQSESVPSAMAKEERVRHTVVALATASKALGASSAVTAYVQQRRAAKTKLDDELSKLKEVNAADLRANDVWQEYERRLSLYLRGEFVARVGSEIERDGQQVLAALLTRDPRKLAAIPYAELPGQTESLFAENRVLDRLWNDFELDKADGLVFGQNAAAGPLERWTRSEDLARFLRKLQLFLRDFGWPKQPLGVRIEPDWASANSLFNSNASPNAPFYPAYIPTNARPNGGVDKAKATAIEHGTKLTVQWQVGVSPTLELAFCTKRSREKSEQDLSIVVPTPFAPFLLAWDGETTSSGGFRIDLRPFADSAGMAKIQREIRAELTFFDPATSKALTLPVPKAELVLR